MKILAIRGRNLASLAGEFEVDFQREPLESAGLFAICGPTGAGKSTLLDALCLALFDNTPRMRGADTNGIKIPDIGDETTLPNDRRNILRRGCAEGFAEVDFRGNDGASYRARWSVRRAYGKAGGKLQGSEMSLQRLPEEQPLEHLKSDVLAAISDRIGLSFEQFTRAVLLAQNEFFTFLKAREDERATLLQTLTGKDRFEVLSKRAYERHKHEQEKLRLLQARLEQQKPLAADERAKTESARDDTRTALALSEARHAQLAAQLRWHQDLAQTREREAAAQSNLDNAIAARNAAAARAAYLEQVESVQPARALFAESDRLARERVGVTHRHDLAAVALAAAENRVAQAKQAREAAKAALTTVELEIQRFKPLLEQARQLDTELLSHARDHESALATQRDAARLLANAQRDLQENESAHARALTARTQAGAWLAAHAHIAPLGDGWIKWSSIFERAANERAALREGETTVASLQGQASQAGAALVQAQSEVERAAQLHATQETALATALRAGEGFDPELLARSASDLDARQHILIAADRTWRDAVNIRAQAAEFERQHAALMESVAAARLRLAQLDGLRPGAEATLAEAERAWQVVFDATQASVEALRTQLHDGTPCPVCGSTTHPYVSQHPAFDDALRVLARRREDAQRTLNDYLVETRALEKDATHSKAQLEQLAPRLAALRERDAAAQRAWAQSAAQLQENFAQPPLPQADAAEIEAWLATGAAELSTARTALGTRERAYRSAQSAIATAQNDCRSSESVLRRAQDTRTALQSSAEQMTTRLEAAVEAQVQCAARLDAWLRELDAAHAEDGSRAAQASTWRARWHSDPQAYFDACREQVSEWENQRKTTSELQVTIARLEAEVTGLQRLATQAHLQHEDTTTAVTKLWETLNAKRQMRAAIFAGTHLPTPVAGCDGADATAMTAAAIESALSQTLASATQSLHACDEQLRRDGEEHARQRSEHDTLKQRLQELQTAANDGGQAIIAWRNAFNREHANAQPLDEARLRRLLDHEPAWLAGEREALQKLDAAVATAQGARATLAQQRIDHEQLRPLFAPAVDDTPIAIELALDESARTVDTLRKELAALELALAQDDLTRRHSAELGGEIEAQENAARIWAQMNELIGASDGKKFRNYAQQLTLDILIAYANAHLKDLARRYRLERVPNSLALMVIDQDMGDEQRSVHSLSGGESFLVSLALALGLASLSSHRVRVESLFIDEGFGSLDADTLRVAMDALDSLQSLGRKVGVISHVAEMTERIGTRIHIKRLPGGQSRVVVSDAR